MLTHCPIILCYHRHPCGLERPGPLPTLTVAGSLGRTVAAIQPGLQHKNPKTPRSAHYLTVITMELSPPLFPPGIVNQQHNSSKYHPQTFYPDDTSNLTQLFLSMRFLSRLSSSLFLLVLPELTASWGGALRPQLYHPQPFLTWSSSETGSLFSRILKILMYHTATLSNKVSQTLREGSCHNS